MKRLYDIISTGLMNQFKPTQQKIPKPMPKKLLNGFRPIQQEIFEPMPITVTEMIDFLKLKGHQCCMYDQHENRLNWCRCDKCKEMINIKYMMMCGNDSMKLLELLRANGHKCIKCNESYPQQILWYHSEPCSHLSSNNIVE